MSDIPKHLRVYSVQERTLSSEEIFDNMRKRITQLEDDNDRLVKECKASFDKESALSVQIDTLKREIENIKQVIATKVAHPQPVSQDSNIIIEEKNRPVEEDKKKILTLSDFKERKAKLNRVSGTLQKIFDRNQLKLQKEAEIAQISELARQKRIMEEEEKTAKQ